MGSAETVVVVVRKDDTLWDIVGGAGFPAKDTLKIYNADFNKDFRRSCKDPNFIKPGQKFALPKYTPADIAELAEQMKKAYAAYMQAEKSLKTMEAMVNVMIKSLDDENKKKQALGSEKVRKIKSEAEALDSLAGDAASECSDAYSCIGAGLISDKFQRKSRLLFDEAVALEKKLKADDDQAKESLKVFQTKLKAHAKVRDRTKSDIKKLEEKWMKANEKAY